MERVREGERERGRDRRKERARAGDWAGKSKDA
jgi:hypothetical protein